MLKQSAYARHVVGQIIAADRVSSVEGASGTHPTRLHIVSEDRWRRSIDCLARHLHPAGVLILLDCLCENDKTTADHVRLRSIQPYRRAFSHVGLHVVDQDRFDLEPEGVTKDLIAVRHIKSP